MTRLITLVLTIICMFGLCACNENNVPPPPPETYAFEAQYIRTNGYSEDRSYPYHVIIDSKEELDAYYEANKELFDLERKEVVYADTTIGFLDACDKYDDAYFERQNLVLIILEEGSGSIRHEITDVRRRWDENGASLGWDITINRNAPELITADMAQWHLFLEVQMGNVMKDGDNVWINGKLSNNIAPQNSAGTISETTEQLQYVPVDWTDFIKINGISYKGDGRETEVSSDKIGKKIAEVSCGVPKVYIDDEGNISDSTPADGASFLCRIGTELFSVIGNDNAIAALVDGKYYLYTADESEKILKIALEHCKTNYDYTDISYLADRGVWEVGFWENGAKIAAQTITIDKDGNVVNIWWAE